MPLNLRPSVPCIRFSPNHLSLVLQVFMFTPSASLSSSQPNSTAGSKLALGFRITSTGILRRAATQLNSPTSSSPRRSALNPIQSNEVPKSSFCSKLRTSRGYGVGKRKTENGKRKGREGGEERREGGRGDCEGTRRADVEQRSVGTTLHRACAQTRRGSRTCSALRRRRAEFGAGALDSAVGAGARRCGGVHGAGESMWVKNRGISLKGREGEGKAGQRQGRRGRTQRAGRACGNASPAEHWATRVYGGDAIAGDTRGPTGRATAGRGIE
ncbi:hypothetical protein B0H16DRAFT_1472358 [Mycena metata]|uniref:Uncharacterized protein n=1 Tax=Mycena metata TaxID=1033252 RepID=A0AAD7HN34_9AGAR|nr:hypothetical protein B0H16DRAFT_1472358 [Mycena metata]